METSGERGISVVLDRENSGAVADAFLVDDILGMLRYRLDKLKI